MSQDAVWLDVLPSMREFGPALAKGTAKEADKTGKEAGSRFGRAMAAGVKATAVGVGAVTVGAVAATKQLYNLGSTFDDVADTIRVGTGATGKDLDALVSVAKSVGNSVPSSFADIGTAVADVNTRLGLTGPTLEKVSSQFLQLGNITGEKVDIGKTTAALSAFGVKGAAVSGALDTLYRVSQASGVTISDLTARMGKSGAVVRNLGLSFDETAVLVGSLDKAGLDSNAMLGAMSRSMVQLAKSGEKPADAFKRTTTQLQAYVKQGQDAKALKLASKVFGTRGAPQFIAALKSGAVNMADLSKVTGQTDDTILKAGEATADFAEQWQLFKNKMSNLVAPAAGVVFDTIGQGMTRINEVAVPALQRFGQEWENGVGAGGKLRDVVGQVTDFVSRQVETVKTLASEWKNSTGRGGELRSTAAEIGATIRDVTGFMVRHKDGVVATAGAVVGLVAVVKLARGAMVAWRAATAVAHGVMVAYRAGVVVAHGAMVAYRGAVAGATAVKRGYTVAVNSSVVATARESAAKVVARARTLADTAATKAATTAKRLFSLETLKATANTVRNTASTVASRVAQVATTAATKAMTAGQWLLNAALTANPIGLVIAALVLLGAGLVIAWKKSDTFRRVVTGAWNGIRTTASTVWVFLRDKVLTPLGRFFSVTLPEKVGVFGKKFGEVWSGLKAAAAKPINFVIGTVYNNGLRKALNLIPGVNLGKADPIPGYRSGGIIPGRFNPARRDNVLGLTASGVPHVRVEPGEFVTNRTATKRHRPLLEAINAGLPGLAGGGYVWPTNSKALSGNYRGHSGVDVAVGTGSPLYAVDRGTITYTGWGRGYGNAVFLQDARGVQWVYGHGSRALVSPGQAVNRGQLIGYSGNTGRSSGPHLHIEAAMGGRFAQVGNRAYTLGLLNGTAIPQGAGADGSGSGFLHLLTELPAKIRGVTTSLGQIPGAWGQLLKPAISTIIGKAKDWGIGKIKSLTDVVGNVASTVGRWTKAAWSKLRGDKIEKWRPLVTQALARSGIGGGRGDEDLWLRQIRTESDGNPNLVQDPRVYDINIRRGDPARGLVQVPGVTWQDFGYGMGPFIPNVYDPYKNLVVGMRAANAQHRSWRNVIGKGHGYASGTGSALPGWTWLGEQGMELVTSPRLAYLRGGEKVYSASHTRSVLAAGQQGGSSRFVSGTLTIDEDGQAYIRGVAVDVVEDYEAASKRWGGR